MYTDYFRFNEFPFSVTPDPRYLFMSTQHQEGLAHLLYGIGEQGGFVALTGEVGTGKTTLCHSLVEQLPPHVDVALLLNPRLNALELLANLCDELRVDYPPKTFSLKTLVDALNSHLLKANAQGRRTVVIIDEAQNLSFEVLEQVRLLTNLETPRAKLLQIILIGQPQLAQLLQRNDLQQLRQRITANFHLSALSARETASYIHHRLDVSGGHTELFTPLATRIVHSYSGGIPRVINTICDRALLGAFTNTQSHVNALTVYKAAHQSLSLHNNPGGNRRFTWVAIAAATILANIYLLYYFGVVRAPDISRNVAAVTNNAPKAPNTLESSKLPQPPAPSPPTKSRSNNLSNKPDRKQTTHSVANKKMVTAATAPLNPQPLTQELESLTDDPSESATHADNSVEKRFMELLAEASSTYDQAFSELVSHWQLDGKEPPVDSCPQLLQHGLHCMTERGTWAQLLRYNRPALLEFMSAFSKPHYATLLSYANGKINLAIGQQRHQISLDQMLPYWHGVYTLFWKPPVANVSLIKPGDTSEAVNWIRQYIISNSDKSITVSIPNYYDNKLRSRIVAFQNAQRLRPDGLIGPKTFMAINNLNTVASIPRLTTASTID